jgi:hypothetical protein
MAVCILCGVTAPEGHEKSTEHQRAVAGMVLDAVARGVCPYCAKPGALARCDSQDHALKIARCRQLVGGA